MQLTPIILFCFATLLSPGPNNVMIMSSAANFGIRKSLPHYFGICLGFSSMVFIITLGFGVVLLKYQYLQLALKIVGAVYLLYLAWALVTSVPDTENRAGSSPLSFMQAVLFQYVNPKAWMIIMGAISTFVLPKTNIIWHEANIAMIFFLTGLLCIGAWMVFGLSLRSIMKNKIYRISFNAIMAACLVFCVVTMFIPFLE